WGGGDFAVVSLARCTLQVTRCKLQVARFTFHVKSGGSRIPCGAAHFASEVLEQQPVPPTCNLQRVTCNVNISARNSRPELRPRRGEHLPPQPLRPPVFAAGLVAPLPQAAAVVVEDVLVGKADGAEHLVGGFRPPGGRLA